MFYRIFCSFILRLSLSRLMSVELIFQNLKVLFTEHIIITCLFSCFGLTLTIFQITL